MAGFVYLIGSPFFKWYKIGKSTTPDTRVKQLGILLPFKIEVIAVWRAENHSELERLLHEKYREFAINGEWFLFERKHVLSLLESMPESIQKSETSFSNLEKDAAPEGYRPQIVYRRESDSELRDVAGMKDRLKEVLSKNKQLREEICRLNARRAG